MPKGLVEPLTCSRAKCNTEIANKLKGNKKCNTKNRFSVGLSTLKPPHNQLTIYFPIMGKAPKILVMTVAPHKLICPQGKT
jgi:hypothetical protein